MVGCLFSRTYLPSPFGAASEPPQRPPTAALLFVKACFLRHAPLVVFRLRLVPNMPGCERSCLNGTEKRHELGQSAIILHMQSCTANIEPHCMAQPVPSCGPSPLSALEALLTPSHGKRILPTSMREPADGAAGETEVATHMSRGWASVNLLGIFCVLCVCQGTANGICLRRGFGHSWRGWPSSAGYPRPI